MPAGTVQGLNEDVRQSLLWALDCRDIAVVGRGTIDGQGANWWKLRAAGADGPRRLRETLRPRMIELLRCTNVRLAGVTCRNSPSWTIHPLVCDNVVVDGITITNPPDSPNTDGINPEACSNVRIANCHIDVGDDCITIKSGTENQPFRSSRPCENITVTGCTMLHGHGGVVIGSEMAGGVRHVAIGNCVFDGTDRGIRIKTRRGRGSAVEHVSVSNVVMRSVRSVVHVTMFYTGTHLDPAPDAHRVAPEPAGPGTPRVRDIRLANLVAEDCQEVGYLAGLPEMPIEDVAMAHVRVSAGRACFAARVRGLSLHDVDVTVAAGPVLVCEDSEDLDIAGLRDRSGDSAAATVELTNVKDAHLHDCRPRSSGRLVHVAGRASGRIVVGPNPLAQGERIVTLSDGAAASAVTRL
jgi:polygalacturonase